VRRLLLALAILAAACRGAVGPYPDASVVLVSIDTLRADRLAPYGYAAAKTPRLAALAADGVLFENVYSHCPLTLPAHASLLTGLLPPRHGVRDNVGFALDPRHATLAARFAAAGLRTGGAVSAWVLRPETGIARGFGFYDAVAETKDAVVSPGRVQRDGAAAVEALGRWIEDQRGARFFAFLHLYEPHSPYAPPERYRSLAQPYDGEVAYADELVGRFLDRLESLKLLDRTIVAVTADHGEGLFDHGEEEHGVFLYREALHVPLFLRLPGRARAGRRVSAVVAQVDVPATLLDLAGLDAAGLDGVSLRGAMAGAALAERPVYSETFYPRYHFGWSELLAVTERRYRYVRAPRPELFDRQADPGERLNLAADRPQAAAALDAWLKAAVGAGTAAIPEPVAAETAEKLRALGYVGAAGGSAPTGDGGGAGPDPKDKIATYETLKRGLALRAKGDDAAAASAFREVVRDSPGLAEAWEGLGFALLRLGKPEDGVAALERSGRLDPSRARAQEAERRFLAGAAARQAGRCTEALASFRRAEELRLAARRPPFPGLHAGAGDCLALSGRGPEAEREFRAELGQDPASEEARVGLAMLYRAGGRDAEARAVLFGLVDADPSADSYAVVLAALRELGDAAGARQWLDRARAAYPADPRFVRSSSAPRSSPHAEE
jgi:choline-sulfatase